MILVVKKKPVLFILTACIVLIMIFLSATQDIFFSKKVLIGKAIVIDAGHGGVDGGTNNQYILEKDVNLDVALRLQKKLEDNGARVIMTRVSDTELAKSNKINRERYIRDLNNRVNIVNNSSANMFLSIHTNSNRNKPSTRGMIAFYANSHPHNREMAYIFQNIFNNYAFNYRGESYKSRHFPQHGKYYLLTNAKIPGILIEMGFITNSTDLFLLRMPEYRDYISDTLYQGVLNYFSNVDSLPMEIDDTFIEEEHVIDMSEEDML